MTRLGKKVATTPPPPAEPRKLMIGEEAALERQAIRRAARGPRPNLNVVKTAGAVATVRADTTGFDPHTVEALFRESLGTSSEAFANTLVEQLGFLAVTRGRNEAGETVQTVSENLLQRHLTLVRAVEPQDELEAMLAAQMAAIHTITMATAAGLTMGGQTVLLQEQSHNRLNKLARTFTTQMEALKRHRAKGDQKVTVEHVHVHEGGQAIVGSTVTTGGRVGDTTEIEDQPHERMLSAERTAMLGLIETDGPSVPGAGHDRQERLPLPRG